VLLLLRSYVGEPQPASVTRNRNAASPRLGVMRAILSRDHGNRDVPRTHGSHRGRMRYN